MIWTYLLIVLAGAAVWAVARLARCLTRPARRVVCFSSAFLCSRVTDSEWHVKQEAALIPKGSGAAYGQKEAASDALLRAGNLGTTPSMHRHLTDHASN